jgi:hypothetical protein
MKTLAMLLYAMGNVSFSPLMTPHANISSTKLGVEDKTFVTDDWEGYHRLIPESQLCVVEAG